MITGKTRNERDSLFDSPDRLFYYPAMATDINDIVLVHINEAPAFFARIEAIGQDIKPEWWQVKLLVLQFPTKTIDWILRDPYIQGETFTMGGTPIRIEKIPPYAESELEQSENPLDFVFTQAKSKSDKENNSKTKGQVISLTDRLKKQPDGED